ncbi:hypothetical protein [Bacillus sp. ISL-55]|uniref:DUF6843 domain-containing protein n=1 Tax=Bacillus sp. ISL-55 TaxID=2819134 RepID=UPI001BEB9B62|nr:hypothetical protein [Bacillus sp. ISL-55]MBT2694766.1 hypothetical protein [Bacillus sp. ISL-55]
MKKIFMIISTTVFLAACSFLDTEEGTNNIFLIPEGYEGTLMVYYGIPDAPAIRKEEDYSVIPIKLKVLEELKGTDISQYGVYFTSTTEIESGIMNNKYYYVDSKGKRTPIDEYCTHGLEIGSFTGESEKEIGFQSVQITATDCGESFFRNGKKDYYNQKGEIQTHWMNQFD